MNGLALQMHGCCAICMLPSRTSHVLHLTYVILKPAPCRRGNLQKVDVTYLEVDCIGREVL